MSQPRSKRKRQAQQARKRHYEAKKRAQAQAKKRRKRTYQNAPVLALYQQRPKGHAIRRRTRVAPVYVLPIAA